MGFTPEQREQCRIVGTPIGNLSDITPRAVEALIAADIIFAEDTRTARELLYYLELSKPLKSYHKDNEKTASASIIAELKKGRSVALISEAGMPGISDPGFILISELISGGFPFEVVPGITACTHAAVASGLVKEGRYLFAGFLPHKDARSEIEKLQKIPFPIIFYESVHRVKNTVKLLMEHFPPPVAVARELTKLHEEIIYINSLSELDMITLKGEFTLVVNNSDLNDETVGTVSTDNEAIASALLSEGVEPKKAVNIMKKLGIKRNEAYEIVENIRSTGR